MNTVDSLGEAQEHARNMLVENFDEKRGIPQRAPSHSDLWPGDRWPEAYIAAGLPDMAEASMEAIARSQRADGSFPHLMQGSHPRWRLPETRWIDRQVYRIEGNGAQRSPSGEWVTKIYAPPTQALSALALVRAGLKVPESLDAEQLSRSSVALLAARQHPYRPGVVVAHKKHELTNADGQLARLLSERRIIIDPAVNALHLHNLQATQELLRLSGAMESKYADNIEAYTHQADEAVSRWVANALISPHKRAKLTQEGILAWARLGGKMALLTEEELAIVLTPPNPQDKHPEKRHLSLAECIEIARLTPYSDISREYLQYTVKKVAQLGAAAMTRFGGIEPSGNAARNKAGRKQLWLPTAAQIVQIEPYAI